MNRLKELRKSRGLTQTELANYIGITQNSYSYWENDKVKIDNASIVKLASFFNVTTDYLLGIEDDFGARTSAPMGDNYSPEERQILEDYRALDFYGKKLVKQTLDVLLAKDSTIEQKKRNNN
jgi:transcriptional regulator with XRE-family HTH domain